MKSIHCLAVLLCMSLLAACSKPSGQAPAPSATTTTAQDVPAGAYELDPAHATLLFRVNHLGFSNYTARFKRFTAHLQFDPKHLGDAQLNVSVDPRSIETDFPDPAKLDFNAELQSAQWLDTAQFPELTFRSTKIEVRDANQLRVNGDLTLHGVTKPVALEASFNGGYAGHPMDPRARIGFSARGALQRSDFGVSYGIPQPGSSMGVSDRVEVIIEAEFSGPPLQNAAGGAAQTGGAGT